MTREDADRSHYLKPIQTSFGILVHPVLPRACGYAFSCELMLKSLLTFRNVNLSKIHDLEKLYCALPDDDKDNMIWEIEDFDTRLHAASCMFNTLRYFSERIIDESDMNVDILFVRDFAHALSKYLYSLFEPVYYVKS